MQSEDDLKLVPGLPATPVNPLLNSDVFDTEVEQVMDNIVANVAVFPPSPKEKRKYTKEEMKRMKGLADFLDAHSSSVQFSKHGLQVHKFINILAYINKSNVEFSNEFILN